jgi:hypothetical protein
MFSRKNSAPDEPTVDATESCLVSVEVTADEAFAKAYAGADKVVASCERCGLSSSERTSDERARGELARLCAERLASEAHPED